MRFTLVGGGWADFLEEDQWVLNKELDQRLTVRGGALQSELCLMTRDYGITKFSINRQTHTYPSCDYYKRHGNGQMKCTNMGPGRECSFAYKACLLLIFASPLSVGSSGCGLY
jgi:hypothetical protein